MINSKEHGKRIATALIAVGFGISVYIFLAHLGVVLLTALIALVATGELLNLLLEKNQPRSLRRWKMITTLVSAGVLFTLLLLNPAWTMIPVYLVFFALFGQALIFSHYDDALATHLRDGVVQFFSLFYITGFLSFVPAVHALPHGPALFALLLLSVWAGDIGAYYGGKTLGRHKLSLNLSPGKTWEGAGCGLLLVAVLGGVFTYFHLPHLPAWHGALLASLSSVAGQIGDLLESLVKRVSGVKDSGNLFPGHGGAFDRFDSLILAAPLFYLLAVFLS